MPTRREPTARQLRLAVELRRLRESAGLTARQAAAMLGVSNVQISQIESGVSGVSEQR
ncbi:helix-turn-helix domain-containing protein, partial [Streptomyces edwardsiae]